MMQDEFELDLRNVISHELSPLEKARLLEILLESIVKESNAANSEFYLSVLKIIKHYYSLTKDEENTICEIAKRF